MFFICVVCLGAYCLLFWLGIDLFSWGSLRAYRFNFSFSRWHLCPLVLEFVDVCMFTVAVSMLVCVYVILVGWHFLACELLLGFVCSLFHEEFGRCCVLQIWCNFYILVVLYKHLAV